MWFEQLIRTVKETPEIGVGTYTVIDVPLPISVLVHRFDAPEGSVLLLHNLADEPVTVDIGKLDDVPALRADRVGTAADPGGHLGRSTTHS